MSKLTLCLLLAFLLIPVLANAQGCPPGKICLENPLNVSSFWDFIYKIVDFVYTLSLWVVPIIIIVAGYYFITAMGQPEKINTAKKIILWALIGLVVIMSAKGLIMLFKDVFGISS